MVAQQRLTEATAAQAVVVTDSQRIISLAMEVGLPCIGIEAGADRLSAPFIFEDPGQIDEEAIETAYCRFHGLPLVIAQTERLRIRELSAADFALVLEWAAAAESAFCESLTMERLCKQVDTVYPLFGYGIWLIEMDTDSAKKRWQPVGLVGFGTDEVPTLGYFVCEGQRRQHIAFEACEAALAYLRELGCCRIDCRIAKDNLASQGLAEKLGFIRCTGQADAAVYDYSMTSITS